MISALKGKKIAVFNGGFSSERSVSLRSGKNVYDSLIRLGYEAFRLDPAEEDFTKHHIDAVFNILHGAYGEDGGIQSLLDFYKIPYTGSGPQASMIAMNKLLTKSVMISSGIPTPKYAVINDPAQALPFGCPWIAKPVAEGSSVGLLICDSKAEFMEKIPSYIHDFGAMMVEEYIQGQEITVGVLGQGSTAKALPILELRPKNRTYDYEAKYTAGMTDFILPAELSPLITQQAQDLAVKLHNTLGCRGMSRTDMMVHPTRGPLVLEINTLPGMTDLSDLPAQAKEAGISFDALVEMILESAVTAK